MGQHKYNPTAIAAKNGELPPKPKSNLSKRQREALFRKEVQDRMYEHTGLKRIMDEVGVDNYFYM